jgi:hypothetical protein
MKGEELALIVAFNAAARKALNGRKKQGAYSASEMQLHLRAVRNREPLLQKTGL